ncbi:hypothetical protein [Lactobacillus johnsonii]|nr:hypothetical protein [Lactobacillus johnsonii]
MAQSKRKAGDRMMLCMARAYVEKYNPKVKLSQKQLIKMVHQIQPTEPLPEKIDSYEIKPCKDFSRRGIISIFYKLGD